MENDRVRANVQKMIGLQAPEADIDGYLASEGLTPEQFKSSVSAPPMPEPDIRLGLSNDPPATQPLSEIPHRLNEMGRSFANGATFGQANKVEAALSPGNYKSNLAKQDQIDAATPPEIKNVGEVAGLVASPATRAIGAGVSRFIPMVSGRGIMGLGQRYANYGTQGGITNTLYQATLGDQEKAKASAAGTGAVGAVGMVAPEGGGAAQSALTAAENFGKGALTGVVPPAVFEGAAPVMRAVFSPILSRLRPEEAAIAGIGRALERGNLTPEMLAAKDAKRGPAAMLANSAPSVTDYARDIAQFPGRARSMAQAGFGAQAGGRMATSGGAVGRVEGAINGSLTDETAKATTDALVDLRTRTSSPLWAGLFKEARVPDSPVLTSLATNPEVRRGMMIGQNIARNDANAVGQALDPTKFNVNGRPTFQAWHAAKEGLDDIQFSGGDNIVNPTTGKLTKYGQSINRMRESVLEELKLHYPEYDDALNTWSGPTQAMRMIELGAKAARGDARVSTELMSGLTDNERDFARIGYADQAKYLASKTKDGANVVKALFGDQNARRNAEAFFPTRAEFNEFRKSLAIESGFHADKGTVLGGSPTASRTLGAEDVAQDIGKATLDGASHGGATGAAAGALSKSWNYLKAEPEAVRDAAGRMLFTTDPAEKAKVIEALRKQQAAGTTYGRPGARMISPIGVFGATKFGF